MTKGELDKLKQIIKEETQAALNDINKPLKEDAERDLMYTLMQNFEKVRKDKKVADEFAQEIATTENIDQLEDLANNFIPEKIEELQGIADAMKKGALDPQTLGMKETGAAGAKHMLYGADLLIFGLDFINKHIQSRVNENSAHNAKLNYNNNINTNDYKKHKGYIVVYRVMGQDFTFGPLKHNDKKKIVALLGKAIQGGFRLMDVVPTSEFKGVEKYGGMMLEKNIKEIIGGQFKRAGNDTLKNGFTITDENRDKANSIAHYIEALVLDYGKNPKSYQDTPTNRNVSKFWTYNRILHFYYDIQSGKKEKFNTKKGPDGMYHLKPSVRAEFQATPNR